MEGDPTVEQSSMVQPEDTSTEVAARLARRSAEAIAETTWMLGAIARDRDDLAAERDAAVARADGWREAFDRSSRLRAGDASERRHLVAEMTKRGLLPVLQEIGREWLAQAAAHAETHGDARGMPADAVGRLVEVARAAREVGVFDAKTIRLARALDALPPGILDQPSGR